MTKSPAQIRAEAEENIRAAHEITGTPRVVIPDVMTRYRRDAEASIAADQEEIECRQRRAAREQRERQRAATSTEAILDLIVAVTSPIIESLQRQLSESAKRALLNETRCTALEKRCASAEKRIASLETRALSAPIDGLSSFAPHSKAH
jgi:hypothetical protein